jgi:hypothetical protein
LLSGIFLQRVRNTKGRIGSHFKPRGSSTLFRIGDIRIPGWWYAWNIKRLAMLFIHSAITAGRILGCLRVLSFPRSMTLALAIVCDVFADLVIGVLVMS